MKSFNLFKPLVAAGVVFGAVGVWATEESSGVRPLSGRVMGSVRGSDPGDPTCTGNFFFRPCTEGSDDKKTCFGAILEKDCDSRKACAGCSDDKQRHEECSSNFPWNALCKTDQNGEAKKGCGVELKNNPKCKWIMDTQKCQCDGEKSVIDCPRKMAVKEDKKCEEFPKSLPK